MTERGDNIAAGSFSDGLKGNCWKKPKNFQEILKMHQKKYPLMEPQDYGKLIFQSEFGPEHMISDREAVHAYLKEEMAAMTEAASPGCPEEIGNGLCRFPLSACSSAEAAALAADLFILTAQEYKTALGRHIEGGGEGELQGLGGQCGGAKDARQRNDLGDGPNMPEAYGTAQGLQGKLELAKELKVSGMEEWAEEWKEKGYPAVHHSAAYREAYHPHYRLLRKEYADFFPVLGELYKLAEKAGEGKHMTVAIDGRCGSGKTTFAGLISRLLPCNVVHMDDFYLPMEQRADNWAETPGGNMDFARLRSEILLPALAGECVCYRPYSCRKGELEETVRLPPCGLTIVEGSYSHHPLLAEAYDLKIFLTCSKQEQIRRLKAREGEYFSAFEQRWIPMEENYFFSCDVEAKSDMILAL